MARIRMSPDLEAAADCDLVIEAVPENLELKRGIFTRLDAICAPGAIFATNTSGLSINALASAVTRRERFVGTHFFTPADVIPLVEVVRNDDTSEATVAVVMDALRAVGKRPVLVRRDIPGFIANRIQHALARDLAAGKGRGQRRGHRRGGQVEPGHPPGAVGSAGTARYERHRRAPRDRQLSVPGPGKPPGAVRAAARQVERGELGAKSGQGFYAWSPERRERVLREKSEALAELAAWLERKAGGG